MNLLQNSSLRHCSDVPLCNYLLAMFLCNYLLLVPLFAYVPVVAFGARRSPKSTSHTDVLTFNCIVFEFILIVSLFVYCAGSFLRNDALVMAGFSVFSIVCCGQTILHVLTCVERHVAVVHPVVYMKQRQSRLGEKIGVACIVFVWLCCGAGIGFIYVNKNENSSGPQYAILAVCVAIVSYCSVTVLLALVRRTTPVKRKPDPAKKKAFKTITFVLAALLLRLVGIPVRGQLFNLVTFEGCVSASVAIWLNLPSSLVLPLLYLQRTEKLPGTKRREQEK